MSIETHNLCPNCGTNIHVTDKMILIGACSPKAIFGDEEMCGYRRKDQLAIDECNQSELKDVPLQQFVDGYFCNDCGVGFVDDAICLV
jgi:hypothetical protein